MLPPIDQIPAFLHAAHSTRSLPHIIQDLVPALPEPLKPRELAEVLVLLGYCTKSANPIQCALSELSRFIRKGLLTRSPTTGFILLGPNPASAFPMGRPRRQGPKPPRTRRQNPSKPHEKRLRLQLARHSRVKPI